MSIQEKAEVEVGAKDLQGPGVVFCPNPKMPLWRNHPRVFIDVATEGHGSCPYCGTVYRLVVKLNENPIRERGLD
jgi:uncharacterized Zn-finger protein